MVKFSFINSTVEKLQIFKGFLNEFQVEGRMINMSQWYF